MMNLPLASYVYRQVSADGEAFEVNADNAPRHMKWGPLSSRLHVVIWGHQFEGL